MTTFQFVTVPRIVFGRGCFARIGELAEGLGPSVLAVVSPSATAGGRLEELTGLLEAAGLRVVSTPQRGEPTVESVDSAAALARGERCSGVIGLGGGSAIDAAKSVAGLLTSGGSALDYMEVVGAGRKITRPAAPWIAIPTTAGTGAEVTWNSVVAYPPRHFKASIRSAHLLARLAVVDPHLSSGTPPAVTAASGMDALCQLIESATSTGANPMTDTLALAGIRMAGRCLLRAYRDGGDAEARDGMALAAMWSGQTLTNAALGAVHGFAAVLGASFPIPHGVVCAALLPHVMRANVAALRAESPDPPALARYAAVGRALVDKPHLPDDQAVDGGLEFIQRLAVELSIPGLGTFGLASTDIPAMVALARKSNSMRYNPVKLSPEVLAEVLRQAM
ncbi:MAG: iron-containing alcohol dehydrogenase [Phycisphaerae bacterium]|nr:iron-containing alcohol dehydrogenase [Phycisphaerae bacterium]